MNPFRWLWNRAAKNDAIRVWEEIMNEETRDRFRFIKEVQRSTKEALKSKSYSSLPGWKWDIIIAEIAKRKEKGRAK